MLSQKNRLKKKKDFERVLKRGKGFKEGFLVLKTIQNNLNIPRFGFVVSQKVSKKAVQRNKIKKRLRKLVFLKIPEIKKGIDGVFIALPGLENKNFWEIKEITDTLFKKAKINK